MYEVPLLKNKSGKENHVGSNSNLEDPESLSELGLYLEHFVSDVDACIYHLLRLVPILMEREVQEVVEFSCLTKYSNMLEETKKLLPVMFALSKEVLYYISCRIMRRFDTVVQILHFTLKPEYRKKIMEPEPCSLRYHKFVEELRTCLGSDHETCLKQKTDGLPMTESYLKDHLLTMVYMYHDAMMEIEDQYPWPCSLRKDTLKARTRDTLELIVGKKGSTRRLAFRILDSSFLNLIETVDPGVGSGPLYVKEAYHFDESANAELLAQGKEREARIAHFQSLIALFKSGKGSNINTKEEDDNAMHDVDSYAEFYINRIEEIRNFRDDLLQECFETLKRELNELIHNAEKWRNISPSSLILPPIIHFVSMKWAYDNMYSPWLLFSKLEHKIGKWNRVLIMAQQEELYHLACMICKKSKYSLVWVQAPILENFSHEVKFRDGMSQDLVKLLKDFS